MTNLSLTLLSIQGIILSKNAIKTNQNTELIHNLTKNILDSQSGSKRSASYNLSLENNLLLKDLIANLSSNSPAK